jgi:hypothetical protein
MAAEQQLVNSTPPTLPAKTAVMKEQRSHESFHLDTDNPTN